MKKCTKCGQVKKLQDFYLRDKINKKYFWKCKECHRRDNRTINNKHFINCSVCNKLAHTRFCNLKKEKVFCSQKCFKKFVRVSNPYTKTHGMTKTRFYKIFHKMKERCNNPRAINYKNYGGRGITYQWKSFEEFKDDMYKSYLRHIEKYGIKETSIDRINNNGNYNKDNCKWSTILEQAQNRRNNKH